MKLWAKRLGVGALVLVGLILYLMHAGKLLSLPHLYPDLSKIHLRNLIFSGLTVLSLAFAWIGASYLVLNAGERLLRLLLPALAFAGLLGLSALCMTQAVADVPCSFTRSLEVCKEEFNPDAYRIAELSLYPQLPTGKLSAYARYEKDGVFSEAITRTYDRDSFTEESNRVAALRLNAFLPPQAPAAQETVCYYLTEGESLWQILIVPKTKTVTYSHFIQADALPDFAPQPAEEAPASP